MVVVQAVHGVPDGRLCSVVFRASLGQEWALGLVDGGAAEKRGHEKDKSLGLLWLHVHETPLRTEVK